MTLLKVYTTATEVQIEVILRKRYRDITAPVLFIRDFDSVLGTYTNTAQSIGLQDVIYNHSCYTLSLPSLWKMGRITSNKVDVKVFQYQEIEELFIENIELNIRPGDLMVKQIILTKSSVPLRFVLHIAKYLSIETLAQFIISHVERTDQRLVQYIKEATTHPVAVGYAGTTGSYGEVGDPGLQVDIRRYIPQSVIPYIPVPIQYYPWNPCINVEKAREFLEFMKTDNKYMITLIELEPKQYM